MKRSPGSPVRLLFENCAASTIEIGVQLIRSEFMSALIKVPQPLSIKRVRVVRIAREFQSHTSDSVLRTVGLQVIDKLLLEMVIGTAAAINNDNVEPDVARDQLS